MTAGDPALRRFARSGALRLVLSAVLALAVFWFLATKVDVGSAWAAIRAMSWLELVTIAAVTGWNLVTYWILWMAATPGLRWPQAIVLAQSGTALTNTVPGGSALGVRLTYDMLDSWGFSRVRSSQAVLVTGVWNTAIKLALPVLAVVLLALEGDATGSRVVAGIAAAAALAVAAALAALVFRGDGTARWLGETAGRLVSRVCRLVGFHPTVSRWGQSTVDFRTRTVDLLRRRWLSITLAAAVSHLSLYLVLLVSLRHVGVAEAAVGSAEVLFVFATTRVLTAIRVTPGGAGVVEALLIGGLTAAGGAAATVTAAVLVFRALTWLLPVPLGALTWLGWRLSRAGRDRHTGAVPAAAPSGVVGA